MDEGENSFKTFKKAQVLTENKARLKEIEELKDENAYLLRIFATLRDENKN